MFSILQWLPIRTAKFMHKYMIILSILHSGNIRLDLRFHVSSSMMHILHHTVSSNPGLLTVRGMCRHYTITPNLVWSGQSCWVRFSHPVLNSGRNFCPSSLSICFLFPNCSTLLSRGKWNILSWNCQKRMIDNNVSVPKNTDYVCY